jgi:hypothetical protein
LALAQIRGGDPSAAWATLAPLAADGFTGLSRDVSWTGSVACAAAVVAEVQQTEAAECLTGLLDPYADQVVVAAGMPFGSVSHYLALLATALHDLDRADALFAVAAETHARINASALLACTQTEWARSLLQRRRNGDAERARDLLIQALGAARTLGLPKLERDAVALLR